VNPNTTRALYRDVLAQVLDNLAFRILLFLVALFVALTFIVGFREDGFVFFFSWKTPYSAFASAGTESSIAPGPELQRTIVDYTQVLVVNYVFGMLLILVSVLTTSFFMPQALEKGMVDTVLSKPVSRGALMLSRYFAGVAFITPLSFLLVGGMHAGFLVASGYSDPAFLWNALVLIYVFAVFHAVSVVAGIFTRSTVAAFLLTLLFWFCNWLAHTVWVGVDNHRAALASLERKDEPPKKADATTPEKAEKPDKPKDEGSALVDMSVWAINALHYALPKTPDATLLSRSLRHSVGQDSQELVDDGSKLSIADPPKGFTREPRSSLGSDDGLLWIAPHPGGKGEAHWSLKREKYGENGSRSTVVKTLKKRLADDPAVDQSFKTDVQRSDIGGHLAERVEWHEKRGNETRLRRQWAFQGGDYLLTLDYDAEIDWAHDETREHAARVFTAGFKFPDGLEDMRVDNHTRQFGWHAQWKHNAWFSILSTLAFVLLVLCVGWWKLSRIDF
jgi:ABC-type transport system involved in multi-copper enzyme maturation permease subunit